MRVIFLGEVEMYIEFINKEFPKWCLTLLGGGSLGGPQQGKWVGGYNKLIKRDRLAVIRVFHLL